MRRLALAHPIALYCAAILLVLMVYLAVPLFEGAPQTYANRDLSQEQYGFESGVDGWVLSSSTCTPITSISQSADRAKVGSHSLKMNLDLNGNDPCKHAGETSVNMRDNPPPAGRAPLNLEGTTITAWVYAPRGARGDPLRPNGVHLFVTDESGNSLYGTWQNILEGGWFQVTLKVGRQSPPCGDKIGAFDPTHVTVLGLNLGTAAGSTATFSGPLYLDSVAFGTLPDLASDHRYDFNDPAAQARLPRWDLNPGWGALAFGPPAIVNNSLAMITSFSMGSDAQRKGYVGIIYAPHLNLSNKTHTVIQANVRFDPAPLGHCPFVATISVYDGERRLSYSNDIQNVGGSDWNRLVFDLADSVQYSPATTGTVPIVPRQVQEVGIQLWANETFSGMVYIDNVIIGGVEISSTYPTINQGIVTANGSNFELAGQPFRFAGANAEYLFQVPDPKVDQVLQTARNWNLSVVRTWGFGEGCDSTTIVNCMYYSSRYQPARGVWNETTFEHLDRIVATASRLGIRLIIPLVDNWEHYGGMPQYMQWILQEHPESIPAGIAPGTDEFHDLFYTNPYAKQWYKDFLTHLLTRTNTITGIRYAADPTIFSWELSNEPRAKSDVSGRTIHAWLKEMSEFARNLDSKHMLGTGEEGWSLMPQAKADACCISWQTFPGNYWQYGVNWMDSYGNNWGSNGSDFVSDHRSITTTVSWQDCVDVYQTPPRCDTAVRTEDRAGLPNISYATFRTYIDEHESNLFRARYCFNGFDSVLCNPKYDYPYDQALQWIDQHLRAARDTIAKPVIMEEFGIHVVGYTYGGGGQKFHRNPPFTETHRLRIFQQYYDKVYDSGINGSLFWNFGFQGMREEQFNSVETLNRWSADANSDTTMITLSSDHISQGTRSLKLDYDPQRGRTKAFVDLGNLHEDWYNTNRAKLMLDIYNAGDATSSAIAISTGSQLTWHESPQQALRCGWNRIVVDVSSETWKSQRTNWNHTGDIAQLDDVQKVSIGIFGYTKPGSVYVDDLRIFFDDGLVVYPGDMLAPTITRHACIMAGIPCYNTYLPIVSSGICQ